jgi:glycosyltransferase involved in cell wall biosynthesis
VRLLFLSMTLPAPPDNGHKLRTWSLLRGLFAEGHQTTLLAFAAPGEEGRDTAHLRALCREVEVVRLDAPSLASGSGALGRLRALATGSAYAERRYRSAEMARRAARRLASADFDAVVADTVFSTVNLPPGGVPLVLNNADVEHLVLERFVRWTRNPAQRAYASVEARRLRRFEAAACGRAAVAMPCSHVDEAVLRSLSPGLRTVVVPNVVDAEAYAPAAPAEGEIVSFQGGLDWYPNRDAVRFFAARVLPLVRRARPSVRFVVAGRNPPARFRREMQRLPGVELTGTVPDMRPVVARSSVCVVPLRIGSGTRIKILEAAAMARPVVSTTLGAEGLDFVDGRDILLADEPGAFAGAVAALLSDAARRRSIGDAARRRVQQGYSPAVLRQQLRRALAHVGAAGQPLAAVPPARSAAR